MKYDSRSSPTCKKAGPSEPEESLTGLTSDSHTLTYLGVVNVPRTVISDWRTIEAIQLGRPHYLRVTNVIRQTTTQWNETTRLRRIR